MAQAVSRRPPTAEARVRSRVSPWGFVVDKVALGQVFPRVLPFFSVNGIPPALHYMEKRKKSSLSQGCAVNLKAAFFRSFCCGARQHKKNSISNMILLENVAENFSASLQEKQFQVKELTCGFYLFGSLKGKMRKTNLSTLEELRNNIRCETEFKTTCSAIILRAFVRWATFSASALPLVSLY
jgi:hypothetical protein